MESQNCKSKYVSIQEPKSRYKEEAKRLRHGVQLIENRDGVRQIHLHLRYLANAGAPYNHKTLMLAEIQIDEYRHREAQVDTRQRERQRQDNNRRVTGKQKWQLKE